MTLLKKVAKEDIKEGCEYVYCYDFPDGPSRMIAYVDSRGKIYEVSESKISYGYVSDGIGQFYGPIELEE